MTFPPLGNSNHVVSVSIDFPINSKQDTLFRGLVYDYSCADWDGLCDHLRDFHERISLNSVLLLLLVNFVSGFRLELIYISLIISIRSNLIHLHGFQQLASESKVKFRQASYHCKRVLEAAKLAYTSKTKESITSQKLGSLDFWQIANSVLNKGKSAIPPLFNRLEVLSSASDKAKLFAKNCFKKSNLDDSGMSLPVFPSRTNQKLHNFSITPKMVKKVITNLDSSKASGPDCIPVVALKKCEPKLSYILVKLFMCRKESCFPDC